jgi:D-beta-D-heptose 7-phosphate kinase/D-beta-D-heptose 1-phosphate adenosyltransferase
MQPTRAFVSLEKSMQRHGLKSFKLQSETGPRAVVAVIGDLMIDRYLSGAVERISPEAPVPVLMHRTDTAVAGGAANVAVNIAALGCDVNLVGAVGYDVDANDLKGILTGAAVSVEWLVADADRPTISKTRIVSGRQQFVRIDRELTTRPSAAVQEQLIKNAREAMAQADIVVLSDYGKGVFSDHVVEKIISDAKSAGKIVLVDPKRRTFEAYRGADLIKPNATELSTASGLPCRTDADVEKAAKVVFDQFDGTLLVTRAEAGMSLLKGGEFIKHFPTSALEVADVSGAGDTALAALAVSLAEGRSIEEAAVLSNIAAGIAVSKLGTAIVNRAELNAAVALAEMTVHHPGALASLEEAVKMAAAWRDRGENVVFTNGCFDLVHAGHIELLSSAADSGDRLIVGLNSDASVQRLKGPTRPIQNQTDRARVIGALRAVDLVVIFDEPTPITLIDAISPDILVKGADYLEDQVVGGDLVKSRGGRVVLVPLVAGRSSTKIVERMRQ